MQVNMKLEVRDCKRITLRGCKLNWYSQFQIAEPKTNLAILPFMYCVDLVKNSTSPESAHINSQCKNSASLPNATKLSLSSANQSTF